MLSVDNEELPSEEEALQAAIQRNLEFSLYRNQRVEQLSNILKSQLPPQALYNTQSHHKIEFKKTQGKATRPLTDCKAWITLKQVSVQKLLICCPENLPPQYYETFENYEEEVL
ncbi:9893_t:CDS:2 [Scutellospora calospora]|uniref:9893_t:CDS:1 n=1 Tax=Scutellospora calospora TaxID=85575 RepID=A0ACA9LL78_9GLOM|nr:9893_t:CDS:2 [Scutellospora calospora]